MEENQKPDKEVLLRIHDLKQYFRVNGSGGFGKRKQYVKANDGITLEIYEGETLGLVGESGCGKSTFGRSLLQLYPDTDGQVLYYGRNINDMFPRYRYQLYKSLPSLIKRLQQLKTKGKRDEYEKLERELATELGGLLCTNQVKELSKLLTTRYTLAKNMLRARQRKQEISSRKEALEAIESQLNLMKQECRNHTEYLRYEDMKDVGVNLRKLTRFELDQIRKDLQLVFQDPYSSLNPKRTVGEIIGEGVKLHGIVKTKNEFEQYIADILRTCGLSDAMIHRYPHEFSGGQRQRIGIARSLAVKPRFLVCDEAVSALDVSIQAQIINLLMDLKEQEQLTYLFISHDLSVIRYISDRIGVMYLGKLVELDECNELFEHPLHPYTKVLLSAIPSIDSKEIAPMELVGEPPSPSNPPSGCRFHTRCLYCQEICKREEPELREVESGHQVACHFAKELRENDDVIHSYVCNRR